MSGQAIAAFACPVLFLVLGALLFRLVLKEESTFASRYQLAVTTLSAIWAARALQAWVQGVTEQYTQAFAEYGSIIVGMMLLLHFGPLVLSGLGKIVNIALLKLGQIARICVRK